MGVKYKTYKELADAYHRGEINEPLMMDNDWCGVYVDEEKVFEGGPYDNIEVLALLGIPAERV